MKKEWKRVLCALALTCTSAGFAFAASAEESAYTAGENEHIAAVTHYGTVSEALEQTCDYVLQIYLAYGDLCIANEISIWNGEEYLQEVEDAASMFREYQAANAAEQEYKDTMRHRLTRIANELQTNSINDAVFSNLGDLLSGDYMGALLGAMDETPGMNLLSINLGEWGT